MKLSSVFLRAFWLSIVPMFFVARYGENHWGFDSIGTWYTVVCAVSFSLILAAVVVAVAVLTGVARKRESKSPPNKNKTDD